MVLCSLGPRAKVDMISVQFKVSALYIKYDLDSMADVVV